MIIHLLFFRLAIDSILRVREKKTIDSILQGDTLDYLGIPGFRIAGGQGVVVIAICQALLMVILSFYLFPFLT
jgi:hypothetical protein